MSLSPLGIQWGSARAMVMPEEQHGGSLALCRFWDGETFVVRTALGALYHSKLTFSQSDYLRPTYFHQKWETFISSFPEI